MIEKGKEGKLILVVIVIVVVIMILFMFSTMVDITLLDPRSLENVTLQITLT